MPAPRGSCRWEGRAPTGMCGCPGSQGASAKTSQCCSQNPKVKNMLNCLYLLQHQKSVRRCWTWGDKTDFLPTWETKASDLQCFPTSTCHYITQMHAVVVTCLHVLAQRRLCSHMCVYTGDSKGPRISHLPSFQLLW